MNLKLKNAGTVKNTDCCLQMTILWRKNICTQKQFICIYLYSSLKTSINAHFTYNSIVFFFLTLHRMWDKSTRYSVLSEPCRKITHWLLGWDSNPWSQPSRADAWTSGPLSVPCKWEALHIIGTQAVPTNLTC